MNVKLTSGEAQIIIDELTGAIIARKAAQPQYALKLQRIKDEILKASRAESVKEKLLARKFTKRQTSIAQKF